MPGLPSLGRRIEYWQWSRPLLERNSQFCVRIGPVTRTADILTESLSSSSSSTNFIVTQVLNKTSGPLCVTYYTTAVMSMLLRPIVCIAVWSAEQFTVFSADLSRLKAMILMVLQLICWIDYNKHHIFHHVNRIGYIIQNIILLQN